MLVTHGMYCSLEVGTLQRPRFSEPLLKQTLQIVDICLQVSDLLCLYWHWLLDSSVCGRHLANEVKFLSSLVSGYSLLLTCHGQQLVSSSTQLRLSPSWALQELLGYGSGQVGTDSFEHGVVLESVLLLTVLQVLERLFGEHLRSLQFFSSSL